MIELTWKENHLHIDTWIRQEDGSIDQQLKETPPNLQLHCDPFPLTI